MYILHYGKLNMRWGHRKNPKVKSSTPKKEVKPMTAEDYKKLRSEIDTLNSAVTSARTAYKPTPMKRDLADWKTDDLKVKVERMALEKRYNELDPPKISHGQERVKRMLETTGTVLATASTAVALIAAIKAMKSA